MVLAKRIDARTLGEDYLRARDGGDGDGGW